MTAVVTDNLPVLAGAPNGIKRLRDLVLELAVTGRLVDQDPNDEPAEQLLGPIFACKDAAIKAAEGIGYNPRGTYALHSANLAICSRSLKVTITLALQRIAAASTWRSAASGSVKPAMSAS